MPNEEWLLPPLLRVLDRAAPQMRIIVHTVQFRTVTAAFFRGASDLADAVTTTICAA